MSSQLDLYLKKAEDTAKTYDFSQVDALKSEPKLESRRRDRKSSTTKKKREVSGNARLQDLCPQDKSKIGELVKKLAAETN